MWARHNAEWRDPAQVISHWQGAGAVDPRLLRYRADGEWWDLLASLGVTVLVTREYEHLVVALRADGGRPALSYLPMPHPSGLAVDAERQSVYVASTRNPNQVYELAPVSGRLPRGDVAASASGERVLVPVGSRFYPGSLYLHDLALIGGELHGNAVGQNAVVRLCERGQSAPVWWPRCVDGEGGPTLSLNHIQLNSIAAGPDLASSYFTASCDIVGSRRPGHRNFAVDRRGVVFSGASREPIARGLTRPHSARRHQGRLWVDDSGYGELVVIEAGRPTTVARLPGWTRGLCLVGDVALVGTSRVIPRFRRYAPGLDVEGSVCAVHAVHLPSGKVLGSLRWPYGNQIFAIELISQESASGLPFPVGRARQRARERDLFYAFSTRSKGGDQ
jgi:uncharacterized protein (TIGR03032 family)